MKNNEERGRKKVLAVDGIATMESTLRRRVIVFHVVDRRKGCSRWRRCTACGEVSRSWTRRGLVKPADTVRLAVAPIRFFRVELPSTGVGTTAGGVEQAGREKNEELDEVAMK